MTPREAATSAFYEDEGSTLSGINAAIDAYEAEFVVFIKDIHGDAPSYPYDGGGTTDGWQMACKRILTLMQSAP